MTESDSVLTVETTHGHERVRIIHDGHEDKPDQRESWWPKTISEGPDGIEWESMP